ncbi:MAG: BMP family ABC transporter substrate-binding protein [Gammaproteobacteria bacterium]|nr:MAG: BMP family ABC transporter substrate-binding protein [Gammaproteobacteria bacterium]
MKGSKFLLFVALAAALAMTGAAAQIAEPLKVAFVYVSPIGDAGWTFQHELGRRQMVAALGDRVETKFIETVPEGAEAERVIRQFAADGYGLVFTTSFGYMNPTIKVAKRFPDIKFEHATGYKRSNNVGTYNVRFYEGRYLAGIVAGGMTKSNIAGYVAAFPIPEVIMGINAFTLGMQSVNAEARTKVIWTNSWYDPGREREAAGVLVTQGADVLTHHTDSTAVVQAAEEKGVYAIGYHSDMSKYGPRAQLTAVTHHWGDFYTRVTREVLDGTWKSRDVWGGIKAGMVSLAPINPVVPRALIAQVKEKEDAIRNGGFHPFQGPVKDQAGKVRIAAGTTIGDDELLKMQWYVQGVQGKLPR